VYTGVPKDYTGDDVTPENFINVLTGNNSATGKKVLSTGPNDDIFIYFSDHGGFGLICFPGRELYAHELYNTLHWMHDNNKYNSIVFYLEACESGSMFNGILNPELNVYAVTASTPISESFACCYDKNVGAYLGDAFSVNFLENSDSFDHLIDETLEDQYNILVNVTTTSLPCQYGNLNLSNNTVAKFLVNQFVDDDKPERSEQKFYDNRRNFINSRDVELDTTIRHYLYTESSEMKNKLLDTIFHILYERYIYGLLYDKELNMINSKLRHFEQDPCRPKYTIDTICLKEKMEIFKSEHGRITNTHLKYIKVIGQSCLRFLD
jgi:glycosylphosphatidylinositol transamidase (GPIT) subunit GPI8